MPAASSTPGLNNSRRYYFLPYLVELENVEEFEELPVLLAVLELDVVLLQAVQGQLRLVVNVHLHRLDTEGAHSRHHHYYDIILTWWPERQQPKRTIVIS
jgi:hypothetical protein